MKNFTKHLTKHFISIVASLILFAGAPMLYAWTSPSAFPPQENISGPITISTVGQNKEGVLGLGGLAVFGKTLLTEISGYALPTVVKPTMLLGVNGAIGAKEYCDENGTNCVTTLGVSTTNGQATSGAGQILPGWPNIIRCSTADGNYVALLYITYKGYPSLGKVAYISNVQSDSPTMITFNFSNGSYDSISQEGTVGTNISNALNMCKNKNISQIPSV